MVQDDRLPASGDHLQGSFRRQHRQAFCWFPHTYLLVCIARISRYDALVSLLYICGLRIHSIRRAMKAVQISRFGGPEVLEIVEVPTPIPTAGQLLVRLCSIGVNLADTLTRMDRYAVTPPLPAILGAEAAGVVEAVGAGADGFSVGQRVAVPLFAGNNLGAYAEFAVIDAGLAVPLPDAISFDQAAALMIQGLTALYLTRQAPPKGKTVLINAAAGGVGSLLVQLAKRAGAGTVIAGASSAAKLEFASSVGADAGVNYTTSDWSEELCRITRGNGPDIIYESVGHEVTKSR